MANYKKGKKYDVQIQGLKREHLCMLKQEINATNKRRSEERFKRLTELFGILKAAFEGEDQK